jgi:3',5'-cyclic AMP phosphodiesterase CpdA
LRRRGPLALIGLSSAVATPLFMATGRLGWAQREKFATVLDAHKDALRVVLIHHPPVSEAAHHKLLTDAPEFLRVIAAHGADLILHGHDHLAMLNWLPGPSGTRVPAVGVPSASAAPGMAKNSAAYNLYRIEGAPGTMRCEMIARGIDANGGVAEQKRMMLAP